MSALMIVLLMTAATFGAALVDWEDSEDESDAGTEETGIEGTDDLLVGTSGADTLSANDGDADTLNGGAGDDLLTLGAGSEATGGAGEDTFYLDSEGSAATAITDFNPAEDSLILDDLHGGVALFETEDGDGLRLVETDTFQTIVTLEGLTLADGETLSLILRDSSGTTPVDTALVLDAPTDAGPDYIDATLGTSAADTLAGTTGPDWILGGAGDDSISGDVSGDVLLGGAGADSLYGGAGSDLLMGGGGMSVLSDDTLGLVLRVDDAANLLDGGTGNDTIWAGPGDTITGGTGDDDIQVFGDVFEDGYTAPLITDFTAGEDVLTVNVPGSDSFGLTEALAALSLSFDSGSGVTTLSLGSEAAVSLTGDNSGLTVVFRDVQSGGDTWVDSLGDTITAEDAASADVILLLQDSAVILNGSTFTAS